MMLFRYLLIAGLLLCSGASSLDAMKDAMKIVLRNNNGAIAIIPQKKKIRKSIFIYSTGKQEKEDFKHKLIIKKKKLEKKKIEKKKEQKEKILIKEIDAKVIEKIKNKIKQANLKLINNQHKKIDLCQEEEQVVKELLCAIDNQLNNIQQQQQQKQQNQLLNNNIEFQQKQPQGQQQIVQKNDLGIQKEAINNQQLQQHEKNQIANEQQQQIQQQQQKENMIKRIVLICIKAGAITLAGFILYQFVDLSSALNLLKVWLPGTTEVVKNNLITIWSSYPGSFTNLVNLYTELKCLFAVSIGLAVGELALICRFIKNDLLPLIKGNNKK